MNVEEEFPSSDGKRAHFSQLGSIQEPTLNQLRDQIKKVMIPFLIKMFQFQLDSSTLSPTKQNCEQLKTLDEDLKNLQLWCQSCRQQLHKAIHQPAEEPKERMTTASSVVDSAISRSFTGAVMGRVCSTAQPASETKPEPSARPAKSFHQTWWRNLLQRKKKDREGKNPQ